MTVAAETKSRPAAAVAFKGGLRDFILALLVMVLIGCAVFVTVWRRVAFIEIGYEIRKLEKAETGLLHQQKELEIEKAMLSSPERIEKVARAKLGLREPDPGQIKVLP